MGEDACVNAAGTREGNRWTFSALGDSSTTPCSSALMGGAPPVDGSGTENVANPLIGWPLPKRNPFMPCDLLMNLSFSLGLCLRGYEIQVI